MYIRFMDMLFFYNEVLKKGHRVQFIEFDRKIRNCATQMIEIKLLAKLSKVDMVSRNTVYHKDCLSKFYNSYRKFKKH